MERPNNYLYRGEQYDSVLGLYYLRARYYNPLTGRFMSRDPKEPKPRNTRGRPFDPAMFHKYLYADGDPVNMIDPTGKGFIEDLQLNRAKQLATSQTGYLYTFDNAGNRKTASEYNGRSVAWNFDGIYRLTGETITGAAGNENGTASYVPDPVGNRASATSSIPGLTPTGGTFNADDSPGKACSNMTASPPTREMTQE
jgi:RHS repeat-associated protein